MDHVEARLKIAELASSMVEAHMNAMPNNYKTRADAVNSFNAFFETIYKNFKKIAPPKAASKSVTKTGT